MEKDGGGCEGLAVGDESGASAHALRDRLIPSVRALLRQARHEDCRKGTEKGEVSKVRRGGGSNKESSKGSPFFVDPFSLCDSGVSGVSVFPHSSWMS